MIVCGKPCGWAFGKKIIVLFTLVIMLFVVASGVVAAENDVPAISEAGVLPEDEDVIVIIPDEPIPGAPAMPEQSEVFVIQEQIELPDSLPQTGGYPAAVLYSFGVLFSGAGILLKNKINKNKK